MQKLVVIGLLFLMLGSPMAFAEDSQIVPMETSQVDSQTSSILPGSGNQLEVNNDSLQVVSSEELGGGHGSSQVTGVPITSRPVEKKKIERDMQPAESDIQEEGSHFGENVKAFLGGTLKFLRKTFHGNIRIGA